MNDMEQDGARDDRSNNRQCCKSQAVFCIVFHVFFLYNYISSSLRNMVLLRNQFSRNNDAIVIDNQGDYLEMLTIAIVDDDDYDRRHLRRLLTRVTYEMGLKAEILLFDNGPDFLSAACCDLVFMDIHMDPLDGLETARVLREKCMTVFLVFMTAGEGQYPAAFSVRAFDYIQKPVEEAQIRRILEDIIRIRKEPASFFQVPQAGNIKIPYSDIRYICSERNYMMFSISRGNDRRFRMTFKSAAGQLQDDPRFLIINRGILVNMQHIRNMTIPSCFMDDGTVFPVNRRKAALLQKTYKKWLLSSWVKKAGKA